MPPTIAFLGAARTVTGSRYLVETSGGGVLVDCGLFQERQSLGLNWENHGIDPARVAAILLTHGHLDHCGWLPRLVKQGFSGPVYATPATADLAPIIVRDAARIQVEDAKTKAKRHAKENRHDVRPAVPLYDANDAEAAVALLRPVKLGETVEPAPGFRATWGENGHILGATWIRLEADGRSIVFSGDIGRWDRPILHDPVPPESADYLITESTYGDRTHLSADVEGQIGEIVAETRARGGNLLIPSFSVERAQELLYALSQLGEKGGLSGMKVYLDSPMAAKVTELFKNHPEVCDAEMLALVRAGKSPFEFAGLSFTRSADESKRLNGVKSGAIIIAGNGMCTGGRIKHHLLHHVGKPETTVLFVGYQAPGTLGRLLADGAGEIRLFNKRLAVRASIRQVNGMSGHADQSELLRWAGCVKTAPKHCFVTHGDEEATETYAGLLRRKYGWRASAPRHGDRVELP